MTSNSNFKNWFPSEITKDKDRDTGMAMVLILLLVNLFTGDIVFYKIAIPVLVLDMSVPNVFRPLSYVWFGISHLIGTIMSKVLLFIVYCLFVVPVVIFRKIIGKDSMKLNEWKKGKESVMTTRNHEYISIDIEKPY